jgi:hypothetical protein
VSFTTGVAAAVFAAAAGSTAAAATAVNAVFDNISSI